MKLTNTQIQAIIKRLDELMNLLYPAMNVKDFYQSESLIREIKTILDDDDEF